MSTKPTPAPQVALPDLFWQRLEQAAGSMPEDLSAGLTDGEMTDEQMAVLNEYAEKAEDWRQWYRRVGAAFGRTPWY